LSGSDRRVHLNAEKFWAPFEITNYQLIIVRLLKN